MRSTNLLQTIDTHTAGEPTRIVLNGLPWDVYGQDSVTAARATFKTHHDELRELLMKEPRGHDNMYGAVAVPPTEDHADFGVFFMHRGGYDEACIHGTIGTVTALIEAGQLPPKAEINIETPAGPFKARPDVRDGQVDAVEVLNVPSFVIGRWSVNLRDVPGVDEAEIALVHAGNNFALVDAETVHITIGETPRDKMVETAMQIRDEIAGVTVDDSLPAETTEKVRFVQFHESMETTDRNVVVFGDGNLDRSPCGTGTCARMVYLHDQGRLDIEQPYRYESIIGTVFRGHIEDTRKIDGRSVIEPAVRGSAYITGTHSFHVDPEDPLGAFSLE